MPKKIVERTAVVEAQAVGQSSTGGPYGSLAYRIHGQERLSYSVPLSEIAGVQLHDGALVEVTVRVIKPGRPKRNPFWWGWRKKGAERERALAEAAR